MKMNSSALENTGARQVLKEKIENSIFSGFGIYAYTDKINELAKKSTAGDKSAEQSLVDIAMSGIFFEGVNKLLREAGLAGKSEQALELGIAEKNARLLGLEIAAGKKDGKTPDEGKIREMRQSLETASGIIEGTMHSLIGTQYLKSKNYEKTSVADQERVFKLLGLIDRQYGYDAKGNVIFKNPDVLQQVNTARGMISAGMYDDAIKALKSIENVINREETTPEAVMEWVIAVDILLSGIDAKKYRKDINGLVSAADTFMGAFHTGVNKEYIGIDGLFRDRSGIKEFRIQAMMLKAMISMSDIMKLTARSETAGSYSSKYEAMRQAVMANFIRGGIPVADAGKGNVDATMLYAVAYEGVSLSESGDRVSFDEKVMTAAGNIPEVREALASGQPARVMALYAKARFEQMKNKDMSADAIEREIKGLTGGLARSVTSGDLPEEENNIALLAALELNDVFAKHDMSEAEKNTRSVGETLKILSVMSMQSAG